MTQAVSAPVPQPAGRIRPVPREILVEASVEVRHIVFFANDTLPEELVVRMEHAPERVTLAEALLSLLKFEGDCALQYDWNAKSVENALRADDGLGYRLVAYRVLPNHVHVLVEAAPGWPAGDPIHRWKQASSPRRKGAPRPGLERFGPDRLRPRALRHELPRPDEFWADEDFERILRSKEEVADARRLIEGIPLPPPRPRDPPPNDAPALTPAQATGQAGARSERMAPAVAGFYATCIVFLGFVLFLLAAYPWGGQ